MWAAVQNGLGIALREMGNKAPDDSVAVKQLTEAIAAFNRSLEEFTPKISPYYHEVAANNLAQAEKNREVRLTKIVK